MKEHQPLVAFLRNNTMPVPAREAQGPLFNGTIYFVQVTFQTPGGPVVMSDADMSTIVEYAQHAVVPIREYASQYGPNNPAVSAEFLKFAVTLNGTSYTDSDLKGWVNDIVKRDKLASTSCIAIVSPQGVTAPQVEANSGYHGRANTPYTVFGVHGTGLTLQDEHDVYAMVVSHEIAELVVDPNVDGSNPEVCDPCDLNCKVLHRCYFDASDSYLGSTQEVPPPYGFRYYVCAVVRPGGALACPASAGDCGYAPGNH